jgi:hypothetical protein
LGQRQQRWWEASQQAWCCCSATTTSSSSSAGYEPGGSVTLILRRLVLGQQGAAGTAAHTAAAGTNNFHHIFMRMCVYMSPSLVQDNGQNQARCGCAKTMELAEVEHFVQLQRRRHRVAIVVLLLACCKHWGRIRTMDMLFLSCFVGQHVASRILSAAYHSVTAACSWLIVCVWGFWSQP